MKKTRDLRRTVLLCVIGGSADAVAYLRFGTFVGAMTGNTVLLGIDLSRWHLDRAAYHAAIVAVFLIAVVLTRSAMLARIPLAVALLVAAVMLGAAAFIGSEWSAAICSAALGIQSAAVRKLGGVSVNTVFVTGNLVRLGVAVPQASASEQRNEVAMLGSAWLAYAVGALLGAVAFRVVGYPMLLPAILALLTAAFEWFASPSRA